MTILPARGKPYPCEAGIQLTFGCNALKNFCKLSVVPRAEKMIFVVSITPEQIWLGVCVGVGLTDGFAGFELISISAPVGPVFDVVAVVDMLH